MKTILTVEESQRLIDLGVDPKMATSKTTIIEEAGLCGRWESEVLLFSLTDILIILPKSYFSEEHFAEMVLSIEVCDNKWFANYRYYCGGELAGQDVEREAPELIETLYQLVIWCLENKIIKLKDS